MGERVVCGSAKKLAEKRIHNDVTLTTLFKKTEMTASEHEVHDAQKEGVQILDEVMPLEVLVDEKTGRAYALKNQKLVKYLESNGIQTRNYFAGNLLMHRGYKHLDDYRNYPESNKVLDFVFFVGSSPTISDKNIEYIKEVLLKYEN